jgi:hypothetical protein
MRIERAISLQRAGYAPGGLGVWPYRAAQPLPQPERRAAARALPPRRLGDAAQLTLLMAQTLSGERRADNAAAHRAYAGPDDRDAIFRMTA